MKTLTLCASCGDPIERGEDSGALEAEHCLDCEHRSLSTDHFAIEQMQEALRALVAVAIAAGVSNADVLATVSRAVEDNTTDSLTFETIGKRLGALTARRCAARQVTLGRGELEALQDAVFEGLHLAEIDGDTRPPDPLAAEYIAKGKANAEQLVYLMEVLHRTQDGTLPRVFMDDRLARTLSVYEAQMIARLANEDDEDESAKIDAALAELRALQRRTQQ